MTVLVHGPGAYPKPPYGSFAGKPAASGDSKNFVQVFTAHGPGGYSKPPYGNFAGKNAQASIPKVGFIGGGQRPKRWWEELEEEYRAKYPPSPAKKAVVARRQVKAAVEQAIVDGLLTESNAPEIAKVAVKALHAPKLAEALAYAARVQEHLDRLREDDEEEAIIMLLLS